MKFFELFFGDELLVAYNCCAFPQLEAITQLGTITAYSPSAFVSPNLKAQSVNR
jgi:hypothetical protein